MAAAAAAATVRPRSQLQPDSIFASVFPPKNHTTPTPEATPNIGSFASPGTAFGGFNLPSDPADEALRHNRAWSAATRFLALPPGLGAAPRSLNLSADAENAFAYLLDSATTSNELRAWYVHEISTHFRRHALPKLRFWEEPIDAAHAAPVLSDTLSILRQAQLLYLSIGHLSTEVGVAHPLISFMGIIKNDFHVLVWHALPGQRLQKTLASYLFNTMKSNLIDINNPERCLKDGRCHCELGLDPDALSSLSDVGLGGANGERALAHAIHTLLLGPAVERRCFQVDWAEETSVMGRVLDWASCKLAPAVRQAVSILTDSPSFQVDVNQLKDAAIASFGRLRVNSLFDYVSSWPASKGAIDDIKEYLRADGSGQKAFLCSSFSEQIQRRLLHAGASTTEILSMYISVIHVFKLLDSRGVLLEKVAVPIRSYLRSREDTVSTIAASFLADVDEDGNFQGHDPEKICADIAIEMAKSAVDADDDRLLNWNDMSWMPDPIDAGPNYKSTKSDDVIAYILALFDPDDFIKALSATFGQHLIHTKNKELMREIRLIELLKSRLDPTKLQQIEVMLKDISDSMHLNRRINPEQYQVQRGPKPTPKDIQAALPEDGITINALYEMFKNRMERKEFQAALHLVATRRNDLYFPKRTRLPAEATSSPIHAVEPKMRFEAKVLSSYFWPQLRDVDFNIPDQVKGFMKQYEDAFADISGQRRLVWKHGLGMTDLKLEFEDRVVEEEAVEVWKTSIIAAFASPDLNEPGTLASIRDDDDDDGGLSLSEVMEALSMDEEYAISGVNFWLNKRVLYEKAEGRYAVLKRLDMDINYVGNDTLIDTEAIPPVKSEDAMLRESAPMYQTFIDGMLRNSGAKEIGGFMGITNMLKMVMPTFSGGDEEIKWLLEDMKSRGEVKEIGDLWGIA